MQKKLKNIETKLLKNQFFNLFLAHEHKTEVMINTLAFQDQKKRSKISNKCFIEVPKGCVNFLFLVFSNPCKNE